MSELVLARIQFASTTLFHFLFVPMSIGLVFMVALMETLYLVKKNELYLKMAKFWGHLFLINFAVGVVTGILQEFQFGLNWSDYSVLSEMYLALRLRLKHYWRFSWNLSLSDYGFSAGTACRKNSRSLHLARVIRNDYVIFLDFNSELLYAGAGRLYDQKRPRGDE